MSITTPSPTAVVPAGWYPDPAGSARLRLWSGTSWTRRLEDRGPLAQPEYQYLSDGAIVSRQEY